jgi:class 3 adenylate cyclase
VAAAEQRIDTATVLFSDMVGSTELRTRLGEEAADALRLTHDDLLRDAIVAQRGIVVKHTGDGVMATFSAAVDAAGAAVAIQQAVDAHNRRSDQARFDVRVGISVGDVTFDGDDCFGLPVIEAQRLEAAARGGQILCAELVRHLARGRGGYEFASVGDLELKGIPDPVPAVEVCWEPIVQIAMPRETPLPPVLAGPRGFDLAGRAAELETLVAAWKDSTEGRRKAVLISGEPGIGKTRLATEIALIAQRQGGLVLGGRCDEELELPFQPFAEALRFQVELDDAPVAWFGALAGELTRLVPDFGEHVNDVGAPVRGDAESDRQRLFDAITAWLRATAASIPVLLVLDDLHWADRPTLLLLRHLIYETAHDAVCIVGTYRSTDLDRTHPLATMLGDLRRDGTVTRLAIDGLSADGVAELLERAGGHELAPEGVELANAVYRETGGNPFFVGEIVRHLVESGALVLRNGRWTSDFTLESVGLPEGVREVVGRRISHLDDETQKLLSLAAVIGHEFSLPVLAAVAGVDEDDALDRLDRVRATSLVSEIGLDRYRFGHALVRATLLDELTTTRRVRTHRKIAETIEALHVDDLDAVVNELAYHYGEAAAAEPGKAVQYAVRAGEGALASSAPDEAARWYALALEHLDADGDAISTHVDLLTRLGQAEYISGTGDARLHLREAARLARQAGLDEAMAGALLVSTRTSFDEAQESDPEKIELLEDLLERIDAPALRARLMGALAVELIFVGDRERRGALLEEAREIAAESGDPLAIVDVSSCHFNARPRSSWSADRFRRDAELGADALAASEKLDDSWWLCSMLLQNAFISLCRNDGAALRAHTARLMEIAEEGRNNVAVRMALLVNQMIATIEGRLVEAEARSIEQFEVWRKAGAPEAVTYRSVEELAVRREQGRVAERLPAYARYLEGRPSDASVVEAILAFGLAESGDLDGAATRLHDMTRVGIASIPDEAGLPLAWAMWTEVAARVVNREAAAALHEAIAICDGLQCATGGIVLGPCARLLALLETLLDRPDDADRHFGESIAQSEQLGSPVWVARSCLDWAERCASRGNRERARELVEQADVAMSSLVLPRLQDQRTALERSVYG